MRDPKVQAAIDHGIEQIKALDAGVAVDNDRMMQGRIELELKRLVNLAALYGVTVPAAEITTEGQLAQVRGMIIPKRFRLKVRVDEENDQRYENRTGRFGHVISD